MPLGADHQAWIERVLGVATVARAPEAATALANGADHAGDAPRPTAEGEQPTEGFFDTLADLAADVKAKVTGTDSRKTDKAALQQRLAQLVDPADATAEEAKAFKQERDAIATALAPDAPPQPNLDAAAKSLATLARLIDTAKRNASVKALAAKDPEAAKQARAAFDKFDRELGDVEVTPAATQAAGQARAAKETELANAANVLKNARKLPDTEKLKAAAIKKATENYVKLKQEADKLADRENAMVGQTSLTAALARGPLSPDSGAPFKPESARQLIAAYNEDPRMADAAVTAAGTARYPDTIAQNVGPMIARAKTGFAATSGEAFASRDTSEKYGQDLLKMGGDVGPEYFARMNDYMASGQQFTADATGAATGASWAEIAKKRTLKLAGTLVKPDGSVDVASDAAKAGVGNILFHPDAMLNKTPALAGQVLKTVDFMADPANALAASNVLKGVTAPTNPAAQKLIRGALGKGDTDALDDTGTRTAVMASMLKPLDQGPVGSCFATAPVRRLRESKPLDAMKGYADIANRGVYKPASGPEFPAVTNLPADDDQLQRSFEYSTAAAAARDAGSIERTTFATNVGAGLDLMKTAAMKHDTSPDKNAAWLTKKSQLANDVANAFSFTYDPTLVIPASSDGSSSQGRYVVQSVSDGKEITTQAEFEAAVTAAALASLGIAPTAPDAADVRAVVTSAAFISAVCPGKYLPWQLAGGGYGPQAAKALGGGTPSAHVALGAVSGTPAPSEGARTKEVLTTMLNTFRGSTNAMELIETAGQHTFNIMPNDPSLAALKGANDTETAQKVQANLIDKGTALKDTSLSAERAGWMFDQAIAQESKAEKDPTLQALIASEAAKVRPTAAMKPAQVTAAIDTALDAYHDRAAQAQTDKWKADQLAASKPVTPTDESAKKAETKKKLNEATLNAARDRLMRDMGAPEFTLADTNWGNGTNHVYFVVAPDPVTGEPMMFKKTVPPGTMTPAGRDWVDRQWQTVH